MKYTKTHWNRLYHFNFDIGCFFLSSTFLGTFRWNFSSWNSMYRDKLYLNFFGVFFFGENVSFNSLLLSSFLNRNRLFELDFFFPFAVNSTVASDKELKWLYVPVVRWSFTEVSVRDVLHRKEPLKVFPSFVLHVARFYVSRRGKAWNKDIGGWNRIQIGRSQTKSFKLLKRLLIQPNLISSGFAPSICWIEYFDPVSQLIGMFPGFSSKRQFSSWIKLNISVFSVGVWFTQCEFDDFIPFPQIYSHTLLHVR